MEKISYKLSEFEGPLDLLLHLISKNKLNIYDIEISVLLSQYIEHIDKMKENNMDVESEFLEMAARLVYIKTVSLLPKHEESESLKKELTGELIEYQECKRIVKILFENANFDSFSRRPAEIEFDMSYKRYHETKEIFESYLSAVGKDGKKIPIRREAFSGIISKRIVSVSSRAIHILRKIYKLKELNYSDLFVSSKNKSEMVATFLAVLELVKGKRLCVYGCNNNIKIKLLNGGAKKNEIK